MIDTSTCFSVNHNLSNEFMLRQKNGIQRSDLTNYTGHRVKICDGNLVSSIKILKFSHFSPIFVVVFLSSTRISKL